MDIKEIIEIIKQRLQEKWPEIRTILYRFFRGAFATALAQTLFAACAQYVDTLDVMKCALTFQDKWTDPAQAMHTLTIAFASGFLVALGKAIRDEFGTDTRGEPNTFNKVSPL